MIDLDAIQTETFDFQHNGAVYSVPTIDSLDADMVLDVMEKDDVNEADVLRLFRRVVAEYAPEARGLTLGKLKHLVVNWRKTGSAGESSPSSD